MRLCCEHQKGSGQNCHLDEDCLQGGGCEVDRVRTSLLCVFLLGFWVGLCCATWWLGAHPTSSPVVLCCAQQNAAQAYAGDACRLGCGVPGALRFHEDAVFVFRQVPLRSVAARLLRPAPFSLAFLPTLFSFPFSSCFPSLLVCVLPRPLPLPLLPPRCYIYSREPVNELPPKMRDVGDEVENSELMQKKQ